MLNLISLELRRFLYSPSSYLLIAGLSFLSGYFFYSLLLSFLEQTHQLAQQTAEQPVDPIVFLVFRLFGNINFLFVFITPLIACRFFASEFKQGTYLLLRMSRLSLWQLILSKYFSLVMIGLIFLFPLLLFPTILWFSGIYELSYVLMGLCALNLCLLVYLAWGLFFSTFSENILICAFLHFAFLISLWLFSYLGNWTSSYGVLQVIEYLSIETHFQNLLRGALSLSNLCFFASAVIIPLYFCQLKLRWREL